MSLWLSLSWVLLQAAILVLAANLKCGYWTCPEAKPGVLNFHVVPYWRLEASDTFENLYENWAKPTLSAVVDELSPNSPRRFSFDQVTFVARWWDEQNVSSRTRMRRLVDSGRLEPLGGGWVQPDEASCHYSALVDQLTLGMRWLQENLGDCGRPRAAWQLNTWGHSVELASLLSQAGLHGLFLSRLPENQASHFVWKADASLGEVGEIFTAAARLGWPEGYCFDADCPKDKLTVANAVGRAENFIKIVASKARNYYFSSRVLQLQTSLLFPSFLMLRLISEPSQSGLASRCFGCFNE
ncbi:lysosomal alpha-mannosidase-like [Dermacentor andersoni]|uniref:lysosomal alpha-mannosidase-like n=1 Tax=Dermacentor andersoni TaxID=34620 RepID=UPI002155D22C|nr:lysosomal alpha-mannosidase-like [Dermacentor andersoni]